LATGGDDGYVRIWDWRTGHQILAFQDNYMVRGVAFSPDGSMLASGGADPPVRMRVAWPRSGELLPELQRRRTCHAKLLLLDDAKLAWAEANGRISEDAPASLSNVQLYLADSNAPLTCPSGGTYQLGVVEDLPSCSMHGAPVENPELTEQFKDIQDPDQLEFKVILARLNDLPGGTQVLLEWLNVAQDEDSPAFQSVMNCLFNGPWVNAGSLNNLAWRWAAGEHRFYRSAVRLARKAVELAPDAGYIWDTLAYAELGAGDVNNAVEHFQKAIDLKSEWAKPGLPLALITRGNPEDLAEALPLLEGYVAASPDHLYVQQALDTLRKMPPPEDSQLRERVLTLLEKFTEQ
jgi:tetratricopeptide (TPR) repeat protein